MAKTGNVFSKIYNAIDSDWRRESNIYRLGGKEMSGSSNPFIKSMGGVSNAFGNLSTKQYIGLATAGLTSYAGPLAISLNNKQKQTPNTPLLNAIGANTNAIGINTAVGAGTLGGLALFNKFRK